MKRELVSSVRRIVMGDLRGLQEVIVCCMLINYMVVLLTGI